MLISIYILIFLETLVRSIVSVLSSVLVSIYELILSEKIYFAQLSVFFLDQCLFQYMNLSFPKNISLSYRRFEMSAIPKYVLISFQKSWFARFRVF